jgi:hypothetical protein
MKKFEVTSGKIVLSDPCYKIPTWCQGVVDRVKNGTWVTEANKTDQDSWGERVSYLVAFNEQALKENPALKETLVNGWGKQLPFDFGVDSGQFGFFDNEHYRNDKSAENLPKYDFGTDFSRGEEGEEWYTAICDITLADEQWGVLPFGVVSSSGFGDGSYSVFAVVNEYDEYVGFMAVFIDENEDDEDDYEDEDE